MVYGFKMTHLGLEEKIYVNLYHRPKVFFGVLGGSFCQDLILCIAWTKVPYPKKFPKTSGFLCPAEHGENESWVPLLQDLNSN